MCELCGACKGSTKVLLEHHYCSEKLSFVLKCVPPFTAVLNVKPRQERRNFFIDSSIYGKAWWKCPVWYWWPGKDIPRGLGQVRSGVLWQSVAHPWRATLCNHTSANPVKGLKVAQRSTLFRVQVLLRVVRPPLELWVRSQRWLPERGSALSNRRLESW